MHVIYERCAALDIGKSIVVACVRRPHKGGGREQEVRTFNTFLDDLVRLASWLAAEGVTHVAMEATGSYWQPIWYVLEDADFELLLCNARHVKHVPGRKTDVADASWLAQLMECGLLRSSFVPPRDIRGLRQVTRYRKRLVQTRTQQAQRVAKVLEAVIKLGSVASSVLSKSGRAMIEALIAGQRDPEVLAQLAKARMRAKIPELIRALDGRFDTDHAAQLRQLLDRIDWLDAAICDLDARVAELAGDHADVLTRLQTIPGVAQRTAEVIVAETGADMARFPTSAQLASWAGVCPGHNESGGKRRSGRTRPGNKWLSEALVEAAWAAARTKDTSLAAKFRRVAGPRHDDLRRKKAAVAVAHKILIASHAIMATPGETYRELGGDWFAKHDNPERRKARLTAQLNKLGYDVELTPTAAA